MTDTPQLLLVHHLKTLKGIVMYGRPRCCKGKTDLNWR